MKKTTLILLTLLISSLSCDELSWVDEQVEAIKPPRSGMSNRNISSIKNPFVFLSKYADKGKKTSPLKITKITQTTQVPNKSKKPSKVLSLSVILNHSAMIGSKWYKVGDSVNGYQVSEISNASVVLIKGKKKTLLSTKSRSKKLKFQNK